jgi:hypothetical protein
VDQYAATGEPTSILQVYLSVYTTGAFAGPQGSWNAATFPDNRALISGCSIKNTVSMFGMEIVLLWNALVLKKRVVIYCDSMEELQHFTRVLPQFVWHRQDWDILRPYCSAKKAEVQELMAAGVYIAGFTDTGVRSNEQLYDVFVDLPARSIQVAEHAKADFALGQIHKDFASFLMTSSEKDDDQVGDACSVMRVVEAGRCVYAVEAG